MYTLHSFGSISLEKPDLHSYLLQNSVRLMYMGLGDVGHGLVSFVKWASSKWLKTYWARQTGIINRGDVEDHHAGSSGSL